MARTKDSVRAVDLYDADERQPSQIEEPQVELSNVRRTPVDIHYQPREEYPHPTQDIVRGEFDYCHEGILGSSSAEGEFQFRTDSRMFIVRMRSGSARLDDVVNALDSQLDQILDQPIGVHRELTNQTGAIWTLLDDAEWIGSVTIRHRGERKPLGELEDSQNLAFGEIIGEYSVVEADFILETPWGEPVNVIYEEGKFEIATTDDDIYEYVLQALEVARA